MVLKVSKFHGPSIVGLKHVKSGLTRENLSISVQVDAPADQSAVRPWGLKGVPMEIHLFISTKMVLSLSFSTTHGIFILSMKIPITLGLKGHRTERNRMLEDTSRVQYMQTYIGAVLDALRNGSNTKGYFVWTVLDCLELLDGYASSYGLYYVDLDDKELPRYQKLSARWYNNFLKGPKILFRGSI